MNASTDNHKSWIGKKEFIGPGIRLCRWILLQFFLFFLFRGSGFCGTSLIQSFIESNDLGSTGFGYSVSCAGDVNGDGYDDIIVGAPYYDSGRGRCLLFRGGALPDSLPDVIMNGESGFFGISVSGAGDVNGDTFDDVLVGAESFNGHTGRVYLYFGGTVMDSTADLVIDGENASDFFGTAVSGAGDVNHDGYDDFLIGANGVQTNTGRVYLYFGSALPDGFADLVFTGENAGDRFGESVSNAGDVDHDGFADILVGAQGYSASTGRVYIYRGGLIPDNTADIVFTGENTGDMFGISVSGAGDLNNDTFDDIIVGASEAAAAAGTVTIYLGAETMDNVSDKTYSGENPDDSFGYSVASAGDVNADGYDDVIIGAYGWSGQTGRAYLCFGGEAFNEAPDLILTGESAGHYFGYSVAGAGLFNNDACHDVIIGAMQVNSYTGRAYLYDGNASMDSDADMVLNGEGANNYFGYSLAGAGDVNGDGYGDILIGAYGYHGSRGRVFLYYGGPFVNSEPGLVFEGETQSSAFGRSVSGAGDVNHDGYSDILIGAHQYQNGTGRVYLYLGAAFMDTQADLILTGEGENEDFGWSVCGVGDVNGDTYDDFMVGAVSSNPYGRISLFLGGIVPDAESDLTFTGEEDRKAGEALAAAGDVNGDGYDDILCGSSPGAFILLGGESPDAVIDVLFPGAGGGFGSAVAGIGDVNGDGFDDVAVGASTLNSNTGRTYIFFGGDPMTILPDVILDGEAANELFGCAISGLGDFNGDGYDDIAVGAYGANYYGGRVSVFWGGDPMDALPDMTVNSENMFDYFGQSVAGTGDVNGDQIPDFLVGASYFGDNHNGKAYLFTGFVEVQINVWLQGPYSGGGMGTGISDQGYLPLKSPYQDSLEAGSVPADITDWIFVQLRTDPDMALVSNRSFFLRSDGAVTETDGSTTTLKMPGVPDGSYYIVVGQRTHLNVMSPFPVLMSGGGL